MSNLHATLVFGEIGVSTISCLRQLQLLIEFRISGHINLRNDFKTKLTYLRHPR